MSKAKLSPQQLQEATSLWRAGWGTYAIAMQLGSAKLEAGVYNAVFYPDSKPVKQRTKNILAFPIRRKAS